MVDQHQLRKADTEARSAERTHVYISGTLSVSGSTLPAKIRNLSETGALVEAPVVPPAGSIAKLTRGSLSATGHVIWSDGGRCGIRFNSPVCVTSWVRPPRNTEQRRIDDIVAGFRSSAVPAVLEKDQREAPTSNVPDRGNVAADLKDLACVLDALAAELVQDENVLRKHADKLQTVDVVVQTLQAASGLLTSSADQSSLFTNRLTNLRTSIAQTLGRL